MLELSILIGERVARLPFTFINLIFLGYVIEKLHVWCSIGWYWSQIGRRKELLYHCDFFRNGFRAIGEQDTGPLGWHNVSSVRFTRIYVWSWCWAPDFTTTLTLGTFFWSWSGLSEYRQAGCCIITHETTEVADHVPMVVFLEHYLATLVRMIPSFKLSVAKCESIRYFEIKSQRNALNLVRVLKETLHSGVSSMLHVPIGSSLTIDNACTRCS